MRRREFLAGMTGAAIGFGAAAGARAQVPISARMAVSYQDAGIEIPADFIGLSFESAALTDADYFTPDNGSVLGLIRLLGPKGVIRIGGNTSERTVWRARDEPVPSGSFVLTPASIDRLAAVLRRLGWKLIYGLNLARRTPEQAAEEAAYVARAVGTNLLAFQIGNEPDGFGRWTAVRPKTYDVAAFLTEWRAFHAAIRARVPDARFAGPDVADQMTWIGALAKEKPAGLILLTRHFYADGPAGASHVSLGRLLHADQQIERVLDALAHDGRTYHLPFRIVEANSIYGEGERGVSDTFGAALWGLGLLFRLAAAGAAGVNFHAGVHNLRPEEDKAYTPIARGAGGRYRAAPLYYGMLMFARAAHGTLVPPHLAADTSDLKAYAARAPDGRLRVTLINQNGGQGARVSIDPGRTFASASVMRLTAPSLDAIAGIRLGGASVDDFGGWNPAEEVVHFDGQELVIDLPPPGAAIVTIGG